MSIERPFRTYTGPIWTFNRRPLGVNVPTRDTSLVLYGLPSGFRGNPLPLSLPLRKKDILLSRLVAASCRPSLGHVVYIHTSISICSQLECTLVTTVVTAAEFKLNGWKKIWKLKLYATGFWHQTESFFNAIGWLFLHTTVCKTK